MLSFKLNYQWIEWVSNNFQQISDWYRMLCERFPEMFESHDQTNWIEILRSIQFDSSQGKRHTFQLIQISFYANVCRCAKVQAWNSYYDIHFLWLNQIKIKTKCFEYSTNFMVSSIAMQKNAFGVLQNLESKWSCGHRFAYVYFGLFIAGNACDFCQNNVNILRGKKCIKWSKHIQCLWVASFLEFRPNKKKIHKIWIN